MHPHTCTNSQVKQGGGRAFTSFFFFYSQQFGSSNPPQVLHPCDTTVDHWSWLLIHPIGKNLQLHWFLTLLFKLKLYRVPRGRAGSGSDPWVGQLHLSPFLVFWDASWWSGWNVFAEVFVQQCAGCSLVASCVSLKVGQTLMDGFKKFLSCCCWVRLPYSPLPPTLSAAGWEFCTYIRVCEC